MRASRSAFAAGFIVGLLTAAWLFLAAALYPCLRHPGQCKPVERQFNEIIQQQLR